MTRNRGSFMIFLQILIHFSILLQIVRKNAKKEEFNWNLRHSLVLSLNMIVPLSSFLSSLCSLTLSACVLMAVPFWDIFLLFYFFCDIIHMTVDHFMGELTEGG